MTSPDSEAKLLKVEKENELLHKQISHMKKQLDKIQNSNSNSNSTTNVTNSIYSPSILSTHSHPLSKIALVNRTSRSKSDALDTIKYVSNNISNIKTNINRATKVPMHKLKRKASTTENITNTRISNKLRLKKYDLMFKIGVDLVGVCQQMTKDKIPKIKIEDFYNSHGGKGNIYSSAVNTKNIDPIFLAKKIGLPPKRILDEPHITLKKIHWHPIKLEDIKGSVWNEVSDNWCDYNHKQFELDFQLRTKKQNKRRRALTDPLLFETCNGMYNILKSKTVTYVDVKRSQQVQIGLKRMNMSNDALRNTLLTLDESKLDDDQIINLLNIIPSTDEQLQAKKFGSAKNQKFGVVENFFDSLNGIIEIEPRVCMWIFKVQFKSKIEHLKHTIAQIENAQQLIVYNSNFKKLLGILLAFGNHMNYGNKINGNAYGFQLSDLRLLPQIKTYDNSMTFPMYVVSFCTKYHPHLLTVIEEFGILEQVSDLHLSSDILMQDYKFLVNNCKKLSQMIIRWKTQYLNILSANDMFISIMSTFEMKCKKAMWKLKFEIDSFHECHKILLHFFACDQVSKISDTKKYGSERSNISNKKCSKKYCSSKCSTSVVSIESIFSDVFTFIQVLKDSKKKLEILDARNKRKKRRFYRKNRNIRSMSVHLTLNRTPVSNIVTDVYAIGMEDVGTPVQTQQKNAVKRMKKVTFSDLTAFVLGNNEQKFEKEDEKKRVEDDVKIEDDFGFLSNLKPLFLKKRKKITFDKNYNKYTKMNINWKTFNKASVNLHQACTSDVLNDIILNAAAVVSDDDGIKPKTKLKKKWKQKKKLKQKQRKRRPKRKQREYINANHIMSSSKKREFNQSRRKFRCQPLPIKTK